MITVRQRNDRPAQVVHGRESTIDTLHMHIRAGGHHLSVRVDKRACNHELGARVDHPLAVLESRRPRCCEHRIDVSPAPAGRIARHDAAYHRRRRVASMHDTGQRSRERRCTPHERGHRRTHRERRQRRGGGNVEANTQESKHHPRHTPHGTCRARQRNHT